MNKDTRIGVLGAGVEGIALIEYLAAEGYKDVIIFDEKDQIEGIPEKIKTVTGKGSFESIFDREVIFRSPGIHIRRLNKARDAGIKITSTTQFFFDRCPCPIIGVTGTKGKGTTSTLIYLILKEAGRDVYLGGNIGESPLNFLGKLNKNSIAVLELSSFQLHDLTKSPQIAVVLRVTSDHMDYHADRDEYWEAKSSIVRYQKAGDVCILNKDYDYTDQYSGLGEAKKYLVSRAGKVEDGAYVNDGKIYYCQSEDCQEICNTSKVALLGEHNLENVMPAITAAKLLKVPEETIRKIVYSFQGLPNRLELVRERDGIRFYNDSFSTTPETSISATYAFKGPVILLAGGSEKFSDYTEWAEELQKNPKLKAVYLTGVTAPRMEESLKSAKEKLLKQVEIEPGAKFVKEFPLKVFKAASMKDALLEAFKMAVSGDNIVMSPAAASFGEFKNYKERGQKFRDWVAVL